MSKKKSIASSFGNLTAGVTPAKPEAAPKRVAAGVIGSTQRSLTEIREERDRLLAEAEKGGQILTLDPADIEPSPFRDRLPDDHGDEFELFKRSLDEEGQRTPISVRRHPEDQHKYQIVFGHRRWRAMADLDKKVEARLGSFSDRDLVVAQGLENAARQDLSWIEKALFCAEMEGAGIKPKDIKSALGVDDAQMSKFRLATRNLPISIIELIGRAPNIGRPRWLELVTALNEKSDLKDLAKTLSADKVANQSSDDRFMVALAAVLQNEPKSAAKPKAKSIQFGSLGEVALGKNDVRFKMKSAHAEKFKAFLLAELPALEARFLGKAKNK